MGHADGHGPRVSRLPSLGVPGVSPTFDRALRRRRQQTIGGAKDRRQAEIDQVDAGDTEGHVSGSHDAFVQQPIDQIEERRSRCLENLIGRRDTLG
jgi:hypothetical protein